ncbi:hypothetical protein N7448_011037 [Penicillium atrosanguineum]|nr:hypothetical protein N7448_011037 [Penicillium atrosanguineum]
MVCELACALNMSRYTSSSTQQCPLQNLPIELRLEIAAYLGGQALSAFAQSCRNLYHILQPTLRKLKHEYQSRLLLHSAAKTDNVLLVEKAMLDYPANVNELFRGKTPIMTALKYSSIEVLLPLLEAPGRDLNVQNKAQKSALWYAVKYGTWRTLLEYQSAWLFTAKLDLRHSRGQTALHRAVWAGKIGIVHILIAWGSDPYAKKMTTATHHGTGHATIKGLS